MTPGVMHMKADLLNSICEIRPVESEVLQSTSKTSVGSRISDRGAHIHRQLRLSVCRRNRIGVIDWMYCIEASAGIYKST